MTYLDYAGPADVTIFGSYTIVVTYIPIYLSTFLSYIRMKDYHCLYIHNTSNRMHLYMYKPV